MRRRVYNTPKSYLDLLHLYESAVTKKRVDEETTRNRLKTGLTKLERANKQVAELQITLTELKPELEQQNIAVALALREVEKDTLIAAEKEAIVSEDTEKVQK
jgi:dynein heavy chain